MREKEFINPNSAKEGDIISFNGLYGEVIKVLNNTVVVDVSIMKDYHFRKMGHERQLVHHSKYKVVNRDKIKDKIK